MNALQRRGTKTSEFWLTLITVGIMIVEKAFDIDLPDDPLYAIVAYILSRGWVKSRAAGNQ